MTQYTRVQYQWGLVILLCLGNFVLHKPLSNLCDALFVYLGRTSYEWLTLLAIGALCVAAALPTLRRRGHELLAPRLLAAMLALAAISVAAQHWLLVSNVELIHFPQFALLAALIVAAGLWPQSAWLVATAAGILDETYQQVVLYADVPDTYIDFNDMVLNGIGAAWAVLLLTVGRQRAGAAPLGAVPPAREWGFRWQGWLAGTMLAALMLALWLDPPQLTPLLRTAATGRPYRVLSAAEGLASLALIWALVYMAHSTRQAAVEPPGGVNSNLDGRALDITVRQ